MSDPSTYRTCWSLNAWREALSEARKSRFVGMDFESTPDLIRPATTSPLRVEDGARVAGFGIAWYDEDTLKSAYCPVRHWRESAGGVQVNARAAAALLSEFIESLTTDQGIVVANMMMELSFMVAERIVWPLPGQIHDVQVAARVLNKGVGIEEAIGLKSLATEHLGRALETKSELDAWLLKHKFKPGRDIWRAPVALASPYCQDDARDALELWKLWFDSVYQAPTRWWWHREPDRTTRKDLYELEIEAATKSVMTSLRGNRVDIDVCRRMADAAKMLQTATRRWIQDAFGMPTLNPGSGTQVRGLLFTEAFGLKVDLAHMTDTFRKLPDREQARLIAGTPEKRLSDYASLDVDALKEYEKQLPERKDIFFMLAVYRKCQTAVMWFEDVVREFGSMNRDPWWTDDLSEWLWIVFHRLRTVGTVSGRMAANDYNSQQVPKRLKMLIAADRLIEILRSFLPPTQLDELISCIAFAVAKDDDEAKFAGVDRGGRVMDFSVRRMMIPRKGCNFRTHDLSQVEMKGFAHFSGNALLCDGYGAPVPPNVIAMELAAIKSVVDGADPKEAFAGLDVWRHDRLERENTFDIHKFVAMQIEISRKDAKGINFGIVYGMGQKKLCRNLGWDAEKGRGYLGQYHSKFPEIQQVQAIIKEKLRERGYIFDPFGRRYYLELARAYVGLNRLIQGWAAGMFKVGFVRVCDLFASPAYGGKYDPIMRRPVMHGAKVLSCVHDELDSEIPYKMDDINLDFAVRSCMTLMGGLKIPLSTSSETSAESWDAVKPVEFKREEHYADGS